MVQHMAAAAVAFFVALFLCAGFASAQIKTAERGGNCGPNFNTGCGGRQCCGISTYCGETADHCVGDKCLQGWGKCGADYIVKPNGTRKAAPDSTTQLASPGQACGPDHNAMCPGSQCCSINGFCGVEPAHCNVSLGCDGIWGYCWPSNSTGGRALPPSPAPPAPAQPQGYVMHPGIIVGIVSSCLVGLAAAIGIAYRVHKWRKEQRQQLGLGPSQTNSSSSGFSQWAAAYKSARLNDSKYPV